MRLFCIISIMILCVTGCYLLPIGDAQSTRTAITIPSVTPASIAQTNALSDNFPPGVYDALPSVMGICFEASWDAADRLFIMRSAEDHIRFYDLADNSELCRNAVRRIPFDFSTGDILVGRWNRGMGCTAQHEITHYERDDTAKTILIQAQFSTAGDCPYELVRGFWLGIEDAQDYEIRLEVE